MISSLAVFVLFWAGLVQAADKSEARSTIDSLAPVLDTIPKLIPSFDSTSTLADYLAVAMERSPRLRSAYNRWIADLKKSDHVGALPDPMFNYAYFIENVETRVGPQEQRFGVRQSFPWFGTLGAKEDMAFAMSQASYQRFEAAKYELYYDVKSAFYDYYFLGQDLQITSENFELLKFWESVAQSKYKVGLKQHPDVIKAQVELGKLEDHLQTLREQVEPKAARLRAWLNLPGDVEIPVPQSITVAEVPLVEDSVVAIITRHNPNLRALDRIIESRRAEERLAGKQTMPSFSIGVDYIQTGEAINPDMSESGKDPWMIGASVSLPIWFGKNSARKKEAEARRRAAEYNLKDSENQLVAVSERLLFEYSDALRKTRLYRDGLVPKAEQSLNAIYAAYQAGETDFLNVLDAQRQLLDFQLTVAREQTRLATKRAQLEMLSGTELSKHLQQ
ncbi:MAG: TolC family protein [candidate division Zixibacteria bacterium]|jgi:outer membrane protein TolC|nr:TolC family protein [candidate division Zixibacteria bacterium]